MNDLKHAESWAGKHRGIPFEVRCTHNRFDNGKDAWVFYIYINEQSFPDDVRGAYVLEPTMETLGGGDKLYRVFEYTASPIANLEWHCGITFYDILWDIRGTRVVKAGCDYSHYYDEGMTYDMERVADDARRCIDSLHDQVNGLLVMNWKDGEYISEDQLPKPGEPTGANR